ncbi:hypothetical protein KPL70_025953 [Citrus sinensis]|nr:hypothetical protein KPL70_025953 [Citrus sinensis]
MTGTWGLASEWPCQLWRVGMMILVHTWLVVETVRDVGLEEGILPMGLGSLEHHSDILMVLAESDQIPTIIQIPRQLPRHELIKLMPLEWISNYEQFHTNTAPIQTSESMFERRQDGTVRMTFKPPPSAPQEPPWLSFTYSSMITAIQTAHEDLPITGFNYDGYPVYPAKQNGHFLWDVPGSGMCDLNCPCWDDWEEDDDYATKQRPKKNKLPLSCQHYEPKSPKDPPPPPAPLPIFKKELKWIAKHCKPEIPSPIPHSTPIVQPIACMMFSSSTSSDYSSSFPPLETHIDSHRNVVSKPFIPSAISSIGQMQPQEEEKKKERPKGIKLEQHPFGLISMNGFINSFIADSIIPAPKENVQSSRLDQCALQATQSEQYVTLEIPTELVSQWKREGYTHLHLGGVRLILTLHGRKGLPVTARLALLDTRFKEYQHAVIGTVLTTLHAGSVLLTFYPNFNFSLDDLNLPTTLKENIPIHGFASGGYLIYPDKINGYFLWDVPGSHMCDPGCPCLEEDDDDDFNRRPRRQKKKSHKMEPCRKRPHLPPDDLANTTPFPIYKKGLRLIQNEYQQKPCKQEANQPSIQPTPIQSCMMITSSLYQEQFPPLEKHTDPQTKVVTKPFILSPVTPTGQLEDPRPFKAVLNWQTQNARAQNSAFKTLDDKIERVATQVKRTDTKGPEFNQKEAEIRRLKAELARIDADKQQPSLFAKTPTLPLHTPTFNTYHPFYTPSMSRQPVDYAKFFGLSHTLYRQTPTPTPPKQKPKPTKTTEPPPAHQQPPSVPDLQSLKELTPKPEPKDKAPLHQYSSQVCSHLSELEDTSSDQESSDESLKESTLSSDSEANLADISKLLMVQPSTGSNDPSPSSSPPRTSIVE